MKKLKYIILLCVFIFVLSMYFALKNMWVYYFLTVTITPIILCVINLYSLYKLEKEIKITQQKMNLWKQHL